MKQLNNGNQSKQTQWVQNAVTIHVHKHVSHFIGHAELGKCRERKRCSERERDPLWYATFFRYIRPLHRPLTHTAGRRTQLNGRRAGFLSGMMHVASGRNRIINPYNCHTLICQQKYNNSAATTAFLRFTFLLATLLTMLPYRNTQITQHSLDAWVQKALPTLRRFL